MTNRKVILIGLDGAIPEHILKFSEEGSTPNIKRIIDEGVFSEALPCPPCDTPTNWTTIATGAWPGTHGITGFFTRKEGESFLNYPVESKPLNVFNTSMCRAEYIWDAAEKAGMISIILNYPTAWPPTIKRGIVVGGGVSGWFSGWIIDKARTYKSPDEDEEASPLTLTEAEDWKNVPPSHSQPLECEIEIAKLSIERWVADGMKDEETGRLIKPNKYRILIIDSEGKGYDKIIISKVKDAAANLGVIGLGEWSRWIRDTYITSKGKIEGYFRIKLEEISPEGGHIRIFRTPIVRIKGWSNRDEACRELAENIGPLIVDFEGYDPEYQCNYLAEAAQILSKKYKWNLMIIQVHIQDRLNHMFCRDVDPGSPGYEEEKAEIAWEAFRRGYRIVDRMIGKIIDRYNDEDTVIMVVSDHGCLPSHRLFWVGGPLIEKGLLAYKWSSEMGRYVPDTDKTKAFPWGPWGYIYINLKGREPHGIVRQGEEYSRVQDEIIDALYSAVDPETGERPVSCALKKEDAAILGQWGPTVGDVIYFMKPGYGIHSSEAIEYVYPRSNPEKKAYFGETVQHGTHGMFLPTAERGGCSHKAVFMALGSNIKEGYMRKRPLWLVDVAPTIAFLLGIKSPTDAQGRVLWDIFDGW